MVRSFQVYSLESFIFCRSFQILSILDMCMTALNRIDAWKYCRVVTVCCAYSAPTRVTCLVIMTPSHRVTNFSSSFVEFFGVPPWIWLLASLTITSSDIANLVDRFASLPQNNISDMNKLPPTLQEVKTWLGQWFLPYSNVVSLVKEPPLWVLLKC